MNIDMGALHAIEVDRGIPVDELLETIKSALLTAYRHTEGARSLRAHRHRPQERHRQGAGQGDRRRRQPGQRMGRHARGFRPGCGHHRSPGDVAAVPRRENERMFGEFSAHEGDIVAGVVQRDARENTRGNVIVRLGTEAKGPRE